MRRGRYNRRQNDYYKRPYYNNYNNYNYGNISYDNYMMDKILSTREPNLYDENVPIEEITLEDEKKIPKMPENILSKPDKDSFNKLIDSYKKQIKEKRDLIEINILKIHEKKNDYDENIDDPIFNEKKKLKERKGELINILKEKKETNLPIRNKIRELKDDLKQYERYHLSTKIKVILNEIENIKEQLCFSKLTSQEEKKLINRKQLLNEYLIPLKKLNDYKLENKDLLQSTSEEKEELKTIDEDLIKVNDNIKQVYKNREEKYIATDNEINNIKLNLDKLREEKRELVNKMKQEYDKFYEKKREYENQQNLIEYINQCEEQIKYLKKNQQKEKKLIKKKEKQKEKQKEKESNENKLYIKIETPKRKYDKEIKECDELINYFLALIPKEEETIKEEINTNENNKLEIIQKKEDLNIGISGGGIKKKKGKKPKMSRRVEYETGGLKLDIDILLKIKNTGFDPPMSIYEIPELILKIKNLKEKYNKENIEISNDDINNFKEKKNESYEKEIEIDNEGNKFNFDNDDDDFFDSKKIEVENIENQNEKNDNKELKEEKKEEEKIKKKKKVEIEEKKEENKNKPPKFIENKEEKKIVSDEDEEENKENKIKIKSLLDDNLQLNDDEEYEKDETIKKTETKNSLPKVTNIDDEQDEILDEEKKKIHYNSPIKEKKKNNNEEEKEEDEEEEEDNEIVLSAKKNELETKSPIISMRKKTEDNN